MSKYAWFLWPKNFSDLFQSLVCAHTIQVKRKSQVKDAEIFQRIKLLQKAEEKEEEEEEEEKTKKKGTLFKGTYKEGKKRFTNNSSTGRQRGQCCEREFVWCQTSWNKKSM